MLVAKIRVCHEASDRTYGSPRIHADLVDAGVRVSQRRVAELMAVHGILGLTGREHSTVTTRRDRIEAPFPDMVKRGFRPATPNTVWYGDITYIWVGSKFWYLATVIDASSKMVIGWKLADHMRAELAIAALHAAIDRRGGLIPVGVIFHSDRGSQGLNTRATSFNGPATPTGSFNRWDAAMSARYPANHMWRWRRSPICCRSMLDFGVASALRV